MALSDLTDNERRLYDALGTISAEEKTFSPLALERYPVLLDAPEVRRRAKAHASTAELAVAARLAITDEIARMLPRDRLVAEAVLCVHKDFEGKSVEQRKAHLEELDGDERITVNQYRRARERILKRIVTSLLPPPMALVPQTVTVRRQAASPPPAIHYLHDLGAKGAGLYYAALAQLFLTDISPELFDSGLIPHESVFDYLNCRTMFADYFDCALVGLVEPFTYSRVLPHKVAESLVVLLKQLRDFGPFDDEKLETIDGLLLDRSLAENSPGWWDSIYQDWTWWYDNRDEKRACIEGVARVGGNVARLIGKHIDYQVAIFQLAKVAAQKRIALCVPFDTWEPIVSGQSFHTRAELYFERFTF